MHMHGLVLPVISTFVFVHAESLNRSDQALIASNLRPALPSDNSASNQPGHRQPETNGSAVDIPTPLAPGLNISAEGEFGRNEHTNEERLNIPWHITPDWMIKLRMSNWLRSKTPPDIACKRLGLTKGPIDLRVFAFWLYYVNRFEKKVGLSCLEVFDKYNKLTTERSVEEVAAILKSLRRVKRLEGTAQLLHRALADSLKMELNTMTSAWQQSGWTPKEVFEVFELGKKGNLYAGPGPAIQWLQFTELLRTEGDARQIPTEDAAQLLIGNRFSIENSEQFIKYVEQRPLISHLGGSLRQALEERKKSGESLIRAAENTKHALLSNTLE
uniref:RXLR phytopathogen effector protein WY-domain domain-containing protein n=1 Tax=Peronospora matthiolae TaxID=2874970 RepID=A0AAV1T299_9STRA